MSIVERLRFLNIRNPFCIFKQKLDIIAHLNQIMTVNKYSFGAGKEIYIHIKSKYVR